MNIQPIKTKIIEFDEKRLLAQGKKITEIPIDLIIIKHDRKYTADSVEELARSVREYGVLSPVKVREIDVGERSIYEIISGQRRLRAAVLSGLRTIPAIVCDITEHDSAVMGMMDDLADSDVHFIEEAEAYYCLMMEHGITQEELAYRMGKSQSTIANKIRLLKLPPRVKRIIAENNLSERHSRSLLRIGDEQLQLRALKTICNKKLNVSKTEMFVSKLLEKQVSASREDQFAAVEAEIAGDSYQVMMCEIRSFINDLKKEVDGLRRAGVITKAAQFDRDDYLEFVVRIPKAENGIKKRMERSL